jgi:thioesterase domain-containing protein
MVPSQFVPLDRMPLTANGKIDRRALPAPQPTTTHARTAPRDDLEARLLTIWEEVLERKSIGVTESFFELGGHSLQAARLAARIELDLGTRVSLAGFFAAPTIDGLAHALREPHSRAVPEGFAAIQREGAEPPFFMVEARSMYWPLARLLGRSRPFFGMPWPEPSQLSQPFRLEDIAAYFVKRIRGYRCDGPYILGGWCMSAVVAFEIARQLREQGQRVEALFLFDGMNPTAYPDFKSGQGIARAFKMWWFSAKFHADRMRDLKPREVMPYLGGRVKTIQGRAAFRLWQIANRSRNTADSFRDIDTMVFSAVMDYRPKPYDGRVIYFERGDNATAGHPDPKYGWGDVVKGSFEMHKIPGRHAEMFQSPNVEIMAEKIKNALSS